MKTHRLRSHIVSPKTKYASVASAAVIVALVLGSFLAIPVPVVLAEGSGGESSFPELAGPSLESVAGGMDPGTPYTDASRFYVERLRAQRDSAVIALSGVPEEPFPELAGPSLETFALAMQPGTRYTDIFKFHVERLRAKRDSALLALSGVPEEPFPELAGPGLGTFAVAMEPGTGYTDVSRFHVERLRAQRDSALIAESGFPEPPFPGGDVCVTC